MKKVLGLILSMVLLVAMFAGCGNQAATDNAAEEATQEATEETAEAAPEAEKTITLGISIDQLFESRVGVVMSAKAKAEELGCKVIEVVADGDAQAQNAQIQTLINQKVDAILVCAVDQNTIETALVAAQNAGIPVVAFDRALPDSQVVGCFVGPDSITDGRLCGDYTAEALKDEEGTVKVLELVGALNDQNGIDRSKGFNDAFAGMDNVEIIQVPTDWDSQTALAGIQNAYQANPDIKAIFCATDTFIPSAETVLTDLNKMFLVGEEGHIVITGVNGSKDGYDASLKGISDGITVMDLKTTGETAVMNALTLIEGGSVEDTVIPGIFYTTDNIEANKDNIWGLWDLSSYTPSGV